MVNEKLMFKNIFQFIISKTFYDYVNMKYKFPRKIEKIQENPMHS